MTIRLLSREQTGFRQQTGTRQRPGLRQRLGKSLLARVALGALLVCGDAAASDPLKIAFVYSGPISDGGWTYQHELGRRMVEAKFGDRVQTAYIESVPETADAERVVRQYASNGYDMVFTTSFGFMEPTAKVAKQFPKVTFEHATGYKMSKNLGIYQTRFYQGAYLLGYLAGKMTKSNTLGYVGSYSIPEVIRNIDAFTLGARSVNPDIQLKVIWVNTWYDPGKEREAAETLVSLGADVMYQNTDSPAIVQVAEEKGLYAFGQDSDMSKYGPSSHLTANTVNWGVYYVKKVQDVLDGKWQPEDTKWGMAEGMIELPPLNKNVPEDIAQGYEALKAKVISGEVQPFAGPLLDQDGKERVAAGQVLPEEELWTLNWYVQGVQGKIPH